MKVSTVVLGVMGLGYFMSSVKDTTIKSTLDNLDIELGKIKITFSGLEAAFKMPITLTNNNPVSFTVYGISGKLKYAQQELGDVTLIEETTFVAGEARVAELELRTTIFSLGDSLYDLISSGAFIGTLRFTGKLVTTIGEISIDENIPVVL